MVTESHRVKKTIKQPLLSFQPINFQLGLIILQAQAFFSIPSWTSFSQGTQILQIVWTMIRLPAVDLLNFNNKRSEQSEQTDKTFYHKRSDSCTRILQTNRPLEIPAGSSVFGLHGNRLFHTVLGSLESTIHHFF